MTTYETFAAFTRIVETGNASKFFGCPVRETVAFLRERFSGRDEFITGDSVLSRLDVAEIQFLPLAIALCAGEDSETLDQLCEGTSADLAIFCN
jgi:hypothetical protein